MKKIIIRADSNEKIAGGHIMRTKSVAYALKEQGAHVIFVTADEKSKALLDDFENVVLGTKYDEMEAEILKFQALIKETQPSAILIDSYFVTKNYFNALKNLAKIAYIDDLNAFCYEVDLLINYSAFLNLEFYKQNLAKKLLLGASFAPLRAEFSKEYNIKPENSRILLTTGNSDNLALAPKLLDNFLNDDELKNLEFLVISGAFNISFDALNELCKAHKNIRILQNVKNMAEVILSAKIVISAAGSTLYELATLGKSVICIKVADNQKGAQKWGQEAMIYAGDATSDIKSVVNNANKALKRLLNEPEFARNLAKNAKKITDGKGACRIAKALLEF